MRVFWWFVYVDQLDDIWASILRVGNLTSRRRRLLDASSAGF